MTHTFEHFDLMPLGRTIKLVERFDEMPDSTFSLCKAILCAAPTNGDPIANVLEAVWDRAYIAFVMDAINANRPYDINAYILGAS